MAEHQHFESGNGVLNVGEGSDVVVAEVEMGYLCHLDIWSFGE